MSLLKFNEGEIKIFDKEMTPDALDTKREIGVIFQDVAVFEELTVEENISYFKLAKSVDTTIEWPNGEDIDPNELYENSKVIE